MEYITTTNLRTKSSQLVRFLQKGTPVSLIHRSKIVGLIEPIKEVPKTFDATKFNQLTKSLGLPHTTYAQRGKKYRAHLMKKYGKSIS